MGGVQLAIRTSPRITTGQEACPGIGERRDPGAGPPLRVEAVRDLLASESLGQAGHK